MHDLLHAWFSDAVLARAKHDQLTDSGDGVWWVNTPQDRRYRVQVTVTEAAVYVICSCRNGQRVGNWPKCHHAAAVLDRVLDER